MKPDDILKLNKQDDTISVLRRSKMCRRRSSVDSGIIVRTPSEKSGKTDEIVRTVSG